MAVQSIANGLLAERRGGENQIPEETAHEGGFFIPLFVIAGLTRQRFLRSYGATVRANRSDYGRNTMPQAATRTTTRLFPLLLAVTTAMLCGCGDDSKTSDVATASASPAQKTMSVDVSGALNLHYEARGDQVSLGFLPGKLPGSNWLTLSADQEAEGDRNEVSIGPILGFSFDNPDQEKKAIMFQGGRVEVAHDENSASYDTGSYYQYFDTDKNGSNSNVQLVFSKIEKLSSPNKLLDRYRLIGTFQFNAALSPEQPTDDCTREAAAYAAEHGERHPGFDARLCNAKSVVAKGSFDITQDFPVTTKADG